MIYFLCDRKACKDCDSKWSECMYTSDIKHAVNFKKVGSDYQEQPALLKAVISAIQKNRQETEEAGRECYAPKRKAQFTVIDELHEVPTDDNAPTTKRKDIVACPYCGKSRIYVDKGDKGGAFTCPICKNIVEWERCE